MGFLKQKRRESVPPSAPEHPEAANRVTATMRDCIPDQMPGDGKGSARAIDKRDRLLIKVQGFLEDLLCLNYFANRDKKIRKHIAEINEVLP